MAQEKTTIKAKMKATGLPTAAATAWEKRAKIRVIIFSMAAGNRTRSRHGLFPYAMERFVSRAVGHHRHADFESAVSKKSKMKKLALETGRAQQVAALPYRLGEEGLEFLVITSRRRKRLIVPKGWPMPGKSNALAASIEAHEEAGAKGRIASEPFGSFEYLKEIGATVVSVTASVFPLRVKKLKSDWKERKERKRRWLTADEAAVELDDGGLRDLVKKYSEHLCGTVI